MHQEMVEYKAHLNNLERSQRTIDGYLGELLFFQKWLEERLNGPVSIKDITGSEINAFLLYLKEERDYKPASRRRIAATLKGFFKWAYKQGYITTDLADTIPSIKVPDTERHFLSPEQVKEWVNAVDNNLVKISMELMYYAGLRISEATNMKLKDVDLQEDGGWLSIRNAKGGKFRKVPIAPVLASILVRYLEERKVDSDYLLATEKTGRIHPVTIQAEMRDARRKLGWEEQITPHTLRHSFASQIYKETNDILVVGRLLGHSKLATTQVYTHLNEDRMLDAVNVL
ncbi:MAG TPA: tyrosine-type recombinase/integrase [Firmicutes bacterium]|nr:tyrosine-type recombinase/integrase [Bacillota bacterium]